MNAVYPDDCYMRFVDACNSHTKGMVYIAAMYHDVIDPFETTRSYLVEFDFKNTNKNCKVIIDGSKIGEGSKSEFSCLCHDLDGFVYIGGNNGFFKYNGTSLEFIDVIFPNKHREIICCARAIGNDIFFGDCGGGVIEYFEGELDRSQLNKVDNNPNWIDGVHGWHNSSVIAVGVKGLVAKRTNSKWEVIPSPSNESLKTVWVVDDKDIYIGGRSGFAWRWDGGGRWIRLKVKNNSEYDITFMDFAWYENFLYAAACTDGLYRLEGDTFVPVTDIGSACVSKLSITDSGLIGLGNVWGEYGNWITHFDGQKWAAHQINVAV